MTGASANPVIYEFDSLDDLLADPHCGDGFSYVWDGPGLYARHPCSKVMLPVSRLVRNMLAHETSGRWEVRRVLDAAYRLVRDEQAAEQVQQPPWERVPTDTAPEKSLRGVVSRLWFPGEIVAHQRSPGCVVYVYDTEQTWLGAEYPINRYRAVVGWATSQASTPVPIDRTICSTLRDCRLFGERTAAIYRAEWALTTFVGGEWVLRDGCIHAYFGYTEVQVIAINLKAYWWFTGRHGGFVYGLDELLCGMCAHPPEGWLERERDCGDPGCLQWPG